MSGGANVFSTHALHRARERFNHLAELDDVALVSALTEALRCSSKSKAMGSPGLATFMTGRLGCGASITFVINKASGLVVTVQGRKRRKKRRRTGKGPGNRRRDARSGW